MTFKYGEVAGGGGMSPIYPNTGALTIPTGLRRRGGLIEIAPNTQFLTQADAKTNPPKGWNWLVNNQGQLASAAVASGIFSATGADAGDYGLNGSNAQAPAFYKDIPPHATYEAIFRMAWPGGTGFPNAVFFRIGTNNTVNATSGFMAFYVDDCATGGGGSGNLLVFSGANLIFTASNGVPGPGTLRAGLWCKLSLRDAYWQLSFNPALQDSPPSSGWVSPNIPGSATESQNRLFLSTAAHLTFTMYRAAVAGTPPTFQIRYFADRIGPDFIANNSDGWRDYTSADGFGTGADMDTEVVKDLDIGASATISDADLRAALVAITNQRSYDAATVTYSAVRSLTGNVGPGTFQDKESVSVAGIGRKFSLYARINSTNRLQQGSIDLSGLRVPIYA